MFYKILEWFLNIILRFIDLFSRNEDRNQTDLQDFLVKHLPEKQLNESLVTLLKNKNETVYDNKNIIDLIDHFIKISISKDESKTNPKNITESILQNTTCECSTKYLSSIVLHLYLSQIIKPINEIVDKSYKRVEESQEEIISKIVQKLENLINNLNNITHKDTKEDYYEMRPISKCPVDFASQYSYGLTIFLDRSRSICKNIFESSKNDFDDEQKKIYKENSDEIIEIALIAYFNEFIFENHCDEDLIKYLIEELENRKDSILKSVNISFSNSKLVRLPLKGLKFFKLLVELDLSKCGLEEDLRDLIVNELPGVEEVKFKE